MSKVAVLCVSDVQLQIYDGNSSFYSSFTILCPVVIFLLFPLEKCHRVRAVIPLYLFSSADGSREFSNPVQLQLLCSKKFSTKIPIICLINSNRNLKIHFTCVGFLHSKFIEIFKNLSDLQIFVQFTILFKKMKLISLIKYANYLFYKILET